MKDFIKLSTRVESAIGEKRPIVLLESTVISKGLPYPDNLEVALKCEEVIEKENVLPATTGIIDGKIVVGLSKEEIEFFAKNSENVSKCNLQNFSVILHKRIYGATTVSATMFIAKLLNLPIIATGGIGGVHLNVEKTFDISSDLIALSSMNVMVVCSGAKCILDIPKTLEYLETMGVPIIGYKTQYFPLFYCNNEKYQITSKFNSPEEIADFYKIHKRLFPNKGIIVANPVPQEFAMDYEKLYYIIYEIQKEAEKKEIEGKALTPFMLSELSRKTEGKTIEVNKALLINNARIAAKIAKKIK